MIDPLTALLLAGPGGRASFRRRVQHAALLAGLYRVVAAAYDRGTGSPWPSRPGGPAAPGGPTGPGRT